LLTSIAAGTLTGWGYARWRGRSWRAPTYRAIWLVFAGFLPQFIAFYLPSTRRILPDDLAAAFLVLSQGMLLGFALVNLRLPGMPFLSIGLGCNLAVIIANGGFMPLSLEALAGQLSPTVLDGLEVGGRIGSASKDILLADSQITLPWLADRLSLPAPILQRYIFSLGDVFVAAGAFWMTAQGQRPAIGSA